MPHLSFSLYVVICGSEMTLALSLFHLAINHTPRMNRNSELICVALLLALSWTTYAEIVQWHECPYPNSDAPANCTIHEVRVDPCREASQGKPCRLKRGHNASISFDYTANFEGDTLETRAYWASQVVDLPFLGMETNACTMTACPVTSGQKQTYSVQLPISKKFPIRIYDLKWKLWNKQEQECCFMFQIKLHK